MKLNEFLSRQLVSLVLLILCYGMLITLQSGYDQAPISRAQVWLLLITDVCMAWAFINLLHYLSFRIFNINGNWVYPFLATMVAVYAVLDRLAMVVFDQHINFALWEAAYFAIIFNELHISYKTWGIFFGSIIATFLIVFACIKFLRWLLPENLRLPGRYSLFIFSQLLLCFCLVNVTVYSVKSDQRLRYMAVFSDFFNIAAWSDTYRLKAPELRTDKKLRQQQMYCVAQNLTQAEVEFGKRKNILLIAAESLRSDMLDKQRMPLLTALAEKSNVLNLTKHYSSANATSTGLFGLMSGINGLYYLDAKKQNVPMPNLKLLEKAGYNINLYASRDIHYADVHEFMFSRLKHNLHTEYDLPIQHADKALIAAFEKSLQQDSGQSRFDFIFFYSSHYDYFYPDRHRLFTPDTKASLGKSEVPNIFKGKEAFYPLFNRYQNSANYVDWLVLETIKTIENNDNLDDWVIVFTGDHGEELGEYGQLGHSFGFRDEQIQVPALIIFPEGETPETKYTVSNHEDILPTLLSWMGINIKLEKFMTGKNLLDYQPEKDTASSIANMMSFDTRYTQVVVGDELKVRFNDQNFPLVQEVYDFNDKPLAEDDVPVQRVLRLLEKYHARTQQLPGDC